MAEASTDKLAFELVSPERVLASVHADMVVVPGEDGDFGVLVEHAPLLSLLRPGVISIYQGQQVEQRIFVEGGFAEVNPKDRSAVEDALQRYNGPLRDAVLRVCRRTGPDELSDPRLSAMKARLADAAKPLLGEHRVRQFIIDKYVSESL